MNQKTFKNLFTSLIVLFIITSSFHVFAQTTYKVVCDKTDNTVKVIEAENRSPNYVPIKGGFPFRQIAQRWIDENYSTTVCNPEELIKQIQAGEKQAEEAQNPNVVQPSPAQSTPAPPLSPRPMSNSAKPRFRNTSLIINAKFSDLGKPFHLESNFAPGFCVGFEQLFGQKTYLGIGLGMNFYFADFSDYGTVTFYSGKFPLFIGHRFYKKNLIIASEIGVEFNTVVQSADSEDDFDFMGLEPNKNSTDILVRFKVGSNKVMGILGTEFGISEVFENNSYKMSAVLLGVQLNF